MMLNTQLYDLALIYCEATWNLMLLSLHVIKRNKFLNGTRNILHVIYVYIILHENQSFKHDIYEDICRHELLSI